LTGTLIAGAAVELAGVGSLLTNDAGEFRFNNVPAAPYTLTARAFGYEPSVFHLNLRSDTTLSISLAVDPLLLDSLRVATRFVTVRGRLVERITGWPIMDGTVYASHNRSARTNRDGRFQFQRVPAGVPFEMRVLAFSYESLSTSFIPERDTTALFELEVDTMVHRLIQQQVQRLEQRMVNATGKGYSVSREQLREAPGGMLGEALAWVMSTAPYSRSRPTLCAFVDERLIAGDPRGFLVPEEIERVEFLHDGGVIRIYTRRFMARMTSETIELQRSGYSEIPRGMRGRSARPQAFCR
jgi:hypothetical protein